jgi:uncharacterized protein (DUF1501 family)
MRTDRLDTRDAFLALSAPEHGSGVCTRRQVLQAAGAGLGGLVLAGILPGALAHAAAEGAAAEAAGPSEPILVVVTLNGGNDGLNTVVPVGNGTYRDRRGALALADSAVRPLASGWGLHPSLGFLASEWQAGRLAVVDGVGYPSPDFSHFSSMATWMQGWGGAAPVTPSGWLGRHLDQLDGGLFRGVVVGGSVPLSFQGRNRRATAVGSRGNEFGAQTSSAHQRVYDAVREMAATPTGRGTWADALARVDVELLDVARTVRPAYQPDLPGDRVARDFVFGARVLNAGLGVRVLGIAFGDFDTHAGQADQHAMRLRQLDDGLRAFFATLAPAVSARTAVVVVSEFGRTLRANNSAGTDHGSASTAFVLGAAVNGGRYGTPASLTALDRHGHLVAPVDFRSLYAAIASGWLGADDTALLGRRYDGLGSMFGPVADAEPARPVVVDAPRPAGFVAVGPERRLDTRDGTGEVAASAVGPGETLIVRMAGRGSVPPTGATAVALNVTVTQPTAAGYLTVWPAGAERPTASSLNFVAGQTVPNHVVAKLGADGSIAVFNSAGRSHVVADVVGYFAESGGTGLVPLPPARVLDTRSSTPLQAGRSLELVLAGAGGVPADGAAAVVLNLTVTEPTAAGYLTVWPAGAARPTASSLNFVAGETVPNLVVAKLGDAGAVKLFTSAGTAHVVADVVAFYGPTERRADAVRAVAVSPSRLLDTRSGTGLGPGSELVVPVAGRAGVPETGVRGVSLNVTVTRPTASGHLTVWPSGQARPLASNLNFRPGQTVPNHVVAKLGPDGAIRVYNSAGRVDVVVDLVGYFAAEA